MRCEEVNSKKYLGSSSGNSMCFTNRGSKLRVLDLTYVHHDHESDCSPQAMRQKQPEEIFPKSKVEKPFMVVTDLELTMAKFDECDTYLLCWAKQQKSSVHLCCRKLYLHHLPADSVIQLFKIVHVDSIFQLQLCICYAESLAHILPYLGQMRSLHTFMMRGIDSSRRRNASPDPEHINLLLSQLSQLSCLKNVYLHDVYILPEHLKKLLR